MITTEEIISKQQQKRFLTFRKACYKANPRYVDNQGYLIQELFSQKTCFTENKEFLAVNILNEGEIACQGIFIYAPELPDYAQLCFFEAKPEQEKAVEQLLKEANRFARKFNCKRLVIGLYGHVNYGLGFLASHFEEKNSFSAAGNPAFYNTYFEALGCESIYMNSYKTNCFAENIKKYERIVNYVEQKYTFRNFDKKNFDRDVKLYTDLNNICFQNHRYYYRRNYKEDKEMLKELFLFMKEDSLMFVYDGEKPVGFLMWYPEYNELLKPGDGFGVKAFIKNRLFGRKIQTVKVMEFGVLEEYRRKGIPLALVNRVYLCAKKLGISKAETSWVLAENDNSNSICQAVCEVNYKRYVVYEKDVS